MPEGLLQFVVGALAGTNLLVGVLNLVPGMPLDGGLVLRAAIWKITGDPHRGTLVAGWAGRVVAMLMLVLAPAHGGARLPHRSDRLHRRGPAGLVPLGGGVAGDLLARRSGPGCPRCGPDRWPAAASRCPADLPLAEAVRRAQEAQAGSIVTVDSAGRPVGLVNEAAVLATPDDRRPWLPTSAVARTLDPGLDPPRGHRRRGR